jgi:hypothetical protein
MQTNDDQGVMLLPLQGQMRMVVRQVGGIVG